MTFPAQISARRERRALPDVTFRHKGAGSFRRNGATYFVVGAGHLRMFQGCAFLPFEATRVLTPAGASRGARNVRVTGWEMIETSG